MNGSIVTNDRHTCTTKLTKVSNWIHADTRLHAAGMLYFIYKRFFPYDMFPDIPVATSMIPFFFEQIVEDSIKERQV